MCVFFVVRHLLFYKTNGTWLLCLCVVGDRNMNDAISTRKKCVKTLDSAWHFFLIEITPFMFLPDHRDTKAMFYFVNYNYTGM